MLAGALREEGHQVRGTTRDPSRLRAIEATGAEAVLCDPDRVATMVPALDHVTVAVLLLGSASGEPGKLAALHGSRLEMLLSKLVDTTIRGLVYEAAGSVDRALLAAGSRSVNWFAEQTHARSELLEVDPARLDRWLPAARDAVVRTLEAR